MAIQYLGVREKVEKKMRCEHFASSNYGYQCILERGHKEEHMYEIKGKVIEIYGCCPDGQIETAEQHDKK